MKSIIPSIMAFVLIFSVIGCSENSSSAIDDVNGLAVIIHEEKEAGFGMRQWKDDEEDIRTRICYEGETCISAARDTVPTYPFFVRLADSENFILTASSPDKVAKGVIIGFLVTKGEGYYEIISGETIKTDEKLELEINNKEYYWHNFEKAEVLYTSDYFNKGDTVTFTYGITE